MRYRSATVAGFHGIPSILQSFKRTTYRRTLRRAFLRIKLQSLKQINAFAYEDTKLAFCGHLRSS